MPIGRFYDSGPYLIRRPVPHPDDDGLSDPAATGFGGTANRRRFASSAVNTPTAPETVTIATRSFAGSIPTAQLRAT